MESIDFKTVLEWLGAIIVSIGGASAILIALAKWFGERFANKLLEKDKAKYQETLEGLKSKYQTELEIKKTDLEKSKTLFLRYSEHQFTLYNELWKSLCDLRNIGEELWEKAELKELKDFSKQLKLTKLTVEKSALLIEDQHYKDLIQILENFGKFEFGKLTLIQLRNRQAHELAQYGVSNNEIDRVINQNRATKQQFALMVTALGTTFKNQIKGE
ncbi:hypothetical protein FNW52_10195 [Flavobacterium sp. ZT3R18]|uniref:hypothetical protein n=1 Tax=Flavobacterium sp. ZT3R18 TaxID=2594429 RepID=UPI00117B9554|nr:hypothetical protein [Flavobacterium sp. ZT3R18]TRX35851.1 hypothetical protein FNW52_10195 [Flavobacterium sp. ZT3R18]